MSAVGVVPGDVVQQGRKVAELMSLRNLVARADVLEEFIKDVRVGAPVTVRPVADMSREYASQAVAIGHMAFRAPNGETTVPVDVTLDAADDFLLPGFNVEIRIRKP